MRKTSLLLALIISTTLSYSQPTSGLFAHWDMNGTTNNVSGTGLNGHGNNLVSAAGQDGIMGHAWYFNGTNSSITIPYSPALNVPSAFTIAAVMRIEGFYTGPCHSNIVFIRGKTIARPSSYFLYYSDAPVGYGCNPGMDTLSESFITTASGPSGGLGPSTFAPYDYSPHIQLNKWYNVVTTFNDTVYKIYINDTLTTTVYAPTPGLPMGTSTDSAAIGYAPYDAPGYPYRFKGVMDDIKLYNRALSPCEVSKLSFWRSSLITSNPVNDTVLLLGSASFTISDTGSSSTYQWQVNTGTTYANVPIAAPYSGANTKILTISASTAAMNGYMYRCIRTSTHGCVDTSAGAKLVINTTSIPDHIKENITIAPNPAKNSISVNAPVKMEKIEIFNIIGRLLISESPYTTNTTINVEALPSGVYILKLNNNYAVKFTKE